MYAKEVEARKKAGGGRKTTLPSAEGKNKNHKGEANTLAAKAGGVSPAGVLRAEKILKHGDPKNIAAVDQGLIPIATASPSHDTPNPLYQVGEMGDAI